MERIICLAIGYLFGMFQTSYIIGKIHHMDIRQYGSGNAGTTNALRTLGKKAGAMTLIGDMLKCVIAILIVDAVFKNRYQEILPLACTRQQAACLDIIFRFILDSGAARELQLLRECCWQWTGEYF